MAEKSPKGEVVLLTGASGCLGFHTLKLLITHDDLCREVRCLDVHRPDETMRQIIDDELRSHTATSGHKKCIKYYEGDIRDINLVEQILSGVGCIIHCAARIDMWTENSDQDESELESINVGGTENLLRAAIRFGVYKFIHVSSFEAYMSYHTVYYATEATMPETDYLIFGSSGRTKRLAEQKVKQYSNNKLLRVEAEGKDSLNAVIVRFPAFYGEYEKYFISRILEVTKFFGGQLQRWSNVWVRHQPIYVGNAAWSLIKTKNRMDHDQSISGEEFHLTDDTPINDPYEFVQPFLEACGMRLRFFDFFGLISKRNSRLDAAIKQDHLRQNPHLRSSLNTKTEPKHWYDVITPQIFGFMCTSNFLNRTKASLRLDYEPLIGPDESKKLAIEWYKNNVKF